MNNIKFLLIGTSLSLIPNLTFAQCVATQDCATLGYTETSCNGGKGVKCPFGNFWACIKSDSECEQQFCDEYGFQYTCSGTGYSKGAGKICNGKYSSCLCANGYVWTGTICQQDYSDCKIGTLFYSDGTCSADKLSDKTLLGVVIYEKTDTENGWIMTISPIATTLAWSTENKDIPDLKNYSSAPDDIQSSCNNTSLITSYGNSVLYPAAWSAKNYSPAGTPSNQSWCLPSAGLLNVINASTNFTKINFAITTAGGVRLGNVASSYETLWSSSENSANEAWSFDANNTNPFEMHYSYSKNYNNNTTSVRPVLAF